ncbi:MAG: hypothetical protein RMJ33_08405 [Saprospiraceae bacterium]|nr:class I SAM-dependent methyltransferase [Saprospiraceae bacterium]MDW8229845.1 hypothetical protein [Saprospiraceae bacterium]
MILTEQEQAFVRQHIDDDLATLALTAHRYPEISVATLLPSMAALRKIRVKAPSWFRLDLDVPPAMSVEQASSEQAARFKASLFSGRRLLDLTGGMGIDAFFWAKAFEEVVYLERGLALAQAARHNFALLGAANIRVENLDAERFLLERAETFDLIYADPSRRDDQQRRVFRFEDCSPNVLALRPLLLQRAAHVLVKAAPMLDLALAQEQMESIERIWVVSVGGEVKELLLLLGHTRANADEIPIEAAMLAAHGTVQFSFNRVEEHTCTPRFSAPQHYLYEPDAALLKAGAFKTFAVRYGLAKLHPHAHLYTSMALVPEAPARCFVVEEVLPYDRRVVQRYLPERKANVAVRHFPDSAEQVRQRLGLSDGGDRYLFGTTGPDGQKILVLCRRTLALI